MQGRAFSSHADPRMHPNSNPGILPMQSLHKPPEGRTADSADFRAAMRNQAGGVCIAATGEGEARRGLTVTAVCSLTVEPPRVLVCINKTAEGHDHFLRNGVFSLNVLGSRHRRLAEVFSGQDGSKGSIRFEGNPWGTSAHGVPVLQDALCALSCRVTRTMDMDSHTVVVGLVLDASYREDGEALLYLQGRFAVAAPMPAA